MTAPAFITLTSYHYAKAMDWIAGLMADLTGSAIKLLMRIAKWTFGFRKWEDKISLSQFQTECGLSRDTVISAIEDLLTLRLIRRVRSGKGFRYALNLPDGLFVENPVENSTPLIHNADAEGSFFTQKSGTSPQNEEPMVEFFDPQIKNVTEKDEEHSNAVELLDALSDINAMVPRSGYELRNLPRWAKRALTLGMKWRDLWALWQACLRVGKNPLALFLNRLMGDGSLPVAKAPPKRNDTKAYFRAWMME